MRRAIPSLPPYVFMMWCLIKYRYNFIFNFIKRAYNGAQSLQCDLFYLYPLKKGISDTGDTPRRE
jgi:hypothetical protein